jgi:uncharacterized repeat protein (TIGR02059 family)
LDLVTASDTGISSTDNRTNDTTPTLTGTGEVGATVTLFRDIDADGVLDTGELLGTAVVGTGGTWTVTTPVLAAGTHILKAYQTDVAGNKSVNSAALSVAVETTPPTLTSATMSAATLVLTFNEALNTAHVPAVGSFTVTVNGTPVVIDSAAISGNTSTLTLHNSTASSDTVLVSYTDPSAGDDLAALQDSVGNDAASLVNRAVTNSTVPTLTSATINGNVLTLTYSETMHGTMVPSSSFYQVSISNTTATSRSDYVNLIASIANIAVSGATVQLTLAESVAATDVVSLSYTDPTTSNDTYAVQGLSGKDAESIVGQSVTNLTVAAGASPFVLDYLRFTETSNGQIILHFSKAITVADASGWTLYQNSDDTPIAITGFSVNGSTLTLQTSASLSAADTLLVKYSGTAVKDGFGNAFTLPRTLAVGGSGATNVQLGGMDEYSAWYWFAVAGGDGNDSLGGGYKPEVLHGGEGMDTLYGAGGVDTLFLAEQVRVTDTVLLDTEDYVWGEPTWIFNLDVSNAAGANNDRIDLPSNTIAANITLANGTDVGALEQHSISNGLVTFHNSSGQAILVASGTSGNFVDAIEYLVTNITTPGTTVAFAVDTDANGSADSLAVFQDVGPWDDDVLAMLVGVNGVTLSNTAGQNVVQIVDSQSPEGIAAPPFTTTGTNDTWFIEFSENIVATSGEGWTLLKNGTTAMTVTGVGTSANRLSLQTNTGLSVSDYVLVSYNAALGTVTDASGNGVVDEGLSAGVALGGSGNTVIDLSGMSGNLFLYDFHGGNDILIGNSGNNELRGGAGGDTLDGGAGADIYEFQQGDAVAVTFADNGGAGLTSGDTFTFAGGQGDVLVGGLDVAGDAGDAIDLDVGDGRDLSRIDPPTSGLVGDQEYFMLQGDYANGSFTVNTATGQDTLVVYDGDNTTEVTQTAFVIDNLTPDLFNDSGAGDITLADETAPFLVSATANENVVTLNFNETLDGAHQPATTGYFQVMAADHGLTVMRSISSLAVNGTTVQLTLARPISETATVTVSYQQPSSGNDVYALQDLSGNDAAGFANAPVTNNTVETSASPFRFGTTPFTEGANATFTFIFTKDIVATDAQAGWTLLKNGTEAMTITSASLTNDKTLTLVTSATLAATDFVIIRYSGSTLTDSFGNPFPNDNFSATIIGCSGANTLDIASLPDYASSYWRIGGGGGDDILLGGDRKEVLADGPGNDLIDGGGGGDLIYLTDGIHWADTVKISTGGWLSGITRIYQFDVTGTTTNDRLNLPSTTVAANAALVDGVDVGPLAKHRISNGILTFYDSSHNPVTIVDTVNTDAALQYLSQNITTPGTTVAFAMDTDTNGFTDSTGVFQASGGGDLDIFGVLDGVQGVTLGTTAAQSVVQIVDNTAPEIVRTSFSSHAIELSYSETITLLSSATHNPILLNGSTALTVTNRTTADNALTLTVSETLQFTDWLLLNTSADVGDSSGNVATSGHKAAIGGSGNTTIDMSGSVDSLYIDGGAGNDTLTASNHGCSLNGGTGADTLLGGSGTDTFEVTQGEGTAAVYTDVNLNGLLDANDTYTFASGVDIVQNFSGNDVINVETPDNFSANVSVLTTPPADGLTIDQRYFLLTGTYNGTLFTVGDGSDTLMIYDGDRTSGLTQSALVIREVAATSLVTNGPEIALS